MLGLMLTAANPAWADKPVSTPVRAPSGGLAWSELSPAQQAALAPLAADWALIDRNRKEKWLEVAARFPAMPAAERERVLERMAPWANMTPTERGQARLKFQEARQLSPDDRSARWEAYQALPEDERREWALRGPASAAAAASSPAAAKAAASQPAAKRNIVQAPKAHPTKPVSPTVVQIRPGATTTLISKPARPPLHHQPGLPKIAATEGFVNPVTLLPRRGQQGNALQPRSDTPADIDP